MYAFLDTLTDDERRLLGHQCMTYLDDTLGAPEPDKRFQHGFWDMGETRVSHEVMIGRVKMTIQGFQKFNLDLYTPKPKDFPISSGCLHFMGALANYQPARETLSDRDIDSEENNFGVMYCGHRNGSRRLFDHPVDAHNTMCFSLSDASMRINGANDPERNEVSISAGLPLWEIEMSPEQFVRMIRSEYSEVPCTIGRSYGYLNDEPPTDYLQARQVSEDIRQSVNTAMAPLSEKVDVVCQELINGTLSSKKKLIAMLDLINEIETHWGELQGHIEQAQTSAVDQVKSEFQSRLMDQVNKDTQQLPHSERQALLGMLRDI
jgi:hypothetical protein